MRKKKRNMLLADEDGKNGNGVDFASREKWKSLYQLELLRVRRAREEDALLRGKCKHMYNTKPRIRRRRSKGGTRGPLLSLPGISVLASRG